MNSMAGEAVVHHHETMFNKTYFGSGFATLDGGTHWWPPNPDKPMQPGAFLIDDKYLFDTDALGKPVVMIKYGAWFRLAIYLMLILLPVFFLRRDATSPNSAELNSYLGRKGKTIHGASL